MKRIVLFFVMLALSYSAHALKIDPTQSLSESWLHQLYSDASQLKGKTNPNEWLARAQGQYRYELEGKESNSREVVGIGVHQGLANAVEFEEEFIFASGSENIDVTDRAAVVKAINYAVLNETEAGRLADLIQAHANDFVGTNPEKILFRGGMAYIPRVNKDPHQHHEPIEGRYFAILDLKNMEFLFVGNSRP